MLCVEGRLGKKRRQCEVREVREWRGVRQSTGVSLFSSGAVGFPSQKTIYIIRKKKPCIIMRDARRCGIGVASPSARLGLGWARGRRRRGWYEVLCGVWNGRGAGAMAGAQKRGKEFEE